MSRWSAALEELDRDAARDAARDELSRVPYQEAQPSLVSRAVSWLGEQLLEAFRVLTGIAPGGTGGLVLLLVLLVLFVAVVLTRVGPLSRRSGARPLFTGGEVLTAARHRELAEQAARDGRWADAVRERLRAVVRDLEARGALDPRPGRTAGEVARDGGLAVPAVAGDLARGARVFDEVWYGGRTADASSYAVLVEVDERVGASRMVLGTGPLP